jgi:hypothetical protein
MFEHRKIIIATKHAKEQVIAPLLESNFAMQCFVPDDFDTDVLGTFSGEVDRTDDPLVTVRKKCLAAMEKYHYDLGIASEGSFGAHPTMFFIPADDEILMLIDKKNNVEIVSRELSIETNFAGEYIRNESELQAFAQKIQFPTHAVLIKKSEKDLEYLQKGISTWDELNQAFSFFLEKFGKAFVETDMRAMYNPSRMKVIEKAMQKMIDKMNSKCPSCHTPGFSITTAIPGLPCENCGAPTRSTLSYVYQCAQCNFTREEKFPHKKTVESATFCDDCNP